MSDPINIAAGPYTYKLRVMFTNPPIMDEMELCRKLVREQVVIGCSITTNFTAGPRPMWEVTLHATDPNAALSSIQSYFADDAWLADRPMPTDNAIHGTLAHCSHTRKY